MLPSPDHRGLGLRIIFLSRPLLGSLALRPGDSLTIPRMALSVGFIRFVSSTNATQATGSLTLSPVGLSPTEHASFSLDALWAKNSILLKTRVFGRPVSVARDNVNGDVTFVLRPVQADFRELPAHPATTREFTQFEFFDLTGLMYGDGALWINITKSGYAIQVVNLDAAGGSKPG